MIASFENLDSGWGKESKGAAWARVTLVAEQSVLVRFLALRPPVPDAALAPLLDALALGRQLVAAPLQAAAPHEGLRQVAVVRALVGAAGGEHSQIVGD